MISVSASNNVKALAILADELVKLAPNTVARYKVIFDTFSVATCAKAIKWHMKDQVVYDQSVVADALRERLTIDEEALEVTKTMIQIATEEIKNQQKQG